MDIPFCEEYRISVYAAHKLGWIQRAVQQAVSDLSILHSQRVNVVLPPCPFSEDDLLAAQQDLISTAISYSTLESKCVQLGPLFIKRMIAMELTENDTRVDMEFTCPQFPGSVLYAENHGHSLSLTFMSPLKLVVSDSLVMEQISQHAAYFYGLHYDKEEWKKVEPTIGTVLKWLQQQAIGLEHVKHVDMNMSTYEYKSNRFIKSFEILVQFPQQFTMKLGNLKLSNVCLQLCIDSVRSLRSKAKIFGTVTLDNKCQILATYNLVEFEHRMESNELIDLDYSLTFSNQPELYTCTFNQIIQILDTFHVDQLKQQVVKQTPQSLTLDHMMWDCSLFFNLSSKMIITLEQNNHKVGVSRYCNYISRIHAPLSLSVQFTGNRVLYYVAGYNVSRKREILSSTGTYYNNDCKELFATFGVRLKELPVLVQVVGIQKIQFNLDTYQLFVKGTLDTFQSNVITLDNNHNANTSEKPQKSYKFTLTASFKHGCICNAKFILNGSEITVEPIACQVLPLSNCVAQPLWKDCIIVFQE